MECVGELTRRRDCVRPASEQAAHFLRRFQIPLGIRVEQIASGRERHFLADAGDDVLQRPAFGRMIMDVIGGQDRAALLASDAVELLDPGAVVAPIKPGGGDVTQ